MGRCSGLPTSIQLEYNVLKICQVLALQYFRKYSKKDPVFIRIVVRAYILPELFKANPVRSPLFCTEQSCLRLSGSNSVSPRRIVTTIHAVSLAANDFQDLIVLFGDFDGQDVIPWVSSPDISFARLTAPQP